MQRTLAMFVMQPFQIRQIYEQYGALRRTFLAEGKGRRPDLPSVVVTNKLFLQLHTLRQESNASWKKLEAWFLKICPNIAAARIRPLVEKTVKTAETLKGHELVTFLSVGRDLDYISRKLSAFGITRASILYPPAPGTLASADCGLITELESYCRSYNVPKDIFHLWLLAFYPHVDRKELEKSVSLACKAFKRVQKNRHYDPQAYDAFLSSDFSLFVSSCPPSGAVKRKKVPIPDQSVSSPKQCKVETDRQLNITTTLLREEQVKFSSLKDDLNSLKRKNLSLTEENVKLKTENKHVKHQKWRSEKSCHDLKNKVSVSKQEFEDKEKELSEVNVKFEKNLKKLKRVQEEKREAIKQADELRSCLENKAFHHDVQIKSGLNNAYSDNIRQATMQLMSEAGVSADNVGKVIRVVSEQVFDFKIKESLPSKQTSSVINREGLVISNIQVVERVLESDNVTIHLDGTSRDHKKILGRAAYPQFQTSGTHRAKKTQSQGT